MEPLVCRPMEAGWSSSQISICLQICDTLASRMKPEIAAHKVDQCVLKKESGI